jgi:hypothetical protein
MFETKLPLQQPKSEFLNATTTCESNRAIPISSAVPVFNLVVLMKSSSSAVTLLMNDNQELSCRNQTSLPDIKMDAAQILSTTRHFQFFL